MGWHGPPDACGCCETPCEHSGCPAFTDDLSGGFDSEDWESIGDLRILHCPIDSDAMRVIVSVSSGGRAIIQYNEGSYLYAAWTGGVLSICTNDGELDDELADCEVDDPPADPVTLCVSWSGGTLRASVDGQLISAEVSATGGRRAGVSTSGSPTDFTLSNITEECPVCAGEACGFATIDCPVCDGALSMWWAIELSGVTSATGFCPEANCTDLDGLYVVGPLEEASVGGWTSFCAAGEAFTGVCLSDDSCFRFAQIIFGRPSSGDLAGHYLLIVEFVSQGSCNEELGLPMLHFFHDFGTEEPDCMSEMPITIPSGETLFVTTPKCQASTASVTITPIPPP